MRNYDFNKVPKELYIEISFPHGYSPLNLLHIFRTPFHKKTSGGILLTQD